MQLELIDIVSNGSNLAFFSKDGIFSRALANITMLKNLVRVFVDPMMDDHRSEEKIFTLFPFPVFRTLIFIFFVICCVSISSASIDEATSLTLANLTGNYSDHGSDLNQDGKYGFLTVDVGLDVKVPGEFSVTGSLYDLKDREIVWAIDHKRLNIGHNRMNLDFDGKAIQSHGINSSFRLKNVVLAYGSSAGGMVWCDGTSKAYNTTQYNFSDFVDPTRTDKTISGSGVGEVLLTINIEKALPVFSGKYSFDIIGINIPPISSEFNVSGSKRGYAYHMDSVYIPDKPNNFSISAQGVKNINVGLRKLQGSYENSSMVWKSKYSRIWVTTQIPADDNGVAIADSDLLSPGTYHTKIFGDAADNVSLVKLNMTIVKKMIMNGKFALHINTTGFPAGNYSMAVKSLNGSLLLDELAVDGLSIDN